MTRTFDGITPNPAAADCVIEALVDAEWPPTLARRVADLLAARTLSAHEAYRALRSAGCPAYRAVHAVEVLLDAGRL